MIKMQIYEFYLRLQFMFDQNGHFLDFIINKLYKNNFNLLFFFYLHTKNYFRNHFFR
jgi:hypothetical protein